MEFGRPRIDQIKTNEMTTVKITMKYLSNESESMQSSSFGANIL